MAMSAPKDVSDLNTDLREIVGYVNGAADAVRALGDDDRSERLRAAIRDGLKDCVQHAIHALHEVSVRPPTRSLTPEIDRLMDTLEAYVGAMRGFVGAPDTIRPARPDTLPLGLIPDEASVGQEPTTAVRLRLPEPPRGDGAPVSWRRTSG